MPCQSEPPTEAEERRMREDDNTMTRLACDRCKSIEASGGEIPKWAKRWWQEHKSLDAERMERNQQQKREASIRKKAISKLSKSERAALGV